MRKIFLMLLSALVALPSLAQKNNYDYNFYGFVRTDFFYNSRDNAASVNEIFYLYPLDVELDAVGEDLNATSSSGFFSFVTRLGLDINGVNIGKANTTAKIEIDFGGYGNYNTLLRIRQAYVNFAWEGGSSLTVGQTWHPLFGDVMPYISNLSTGAPFQPFNRSPQLRYQYMSGGGFKFTAAALTQLQYTSSGVNGSSNEYMINSATPEFYGGIDYINGGFQVGAGVDVLTLKPSTEVTYDNAIYKVDEKLTAVSGEVHLRYHAKKFKLGVKSLLASALDHTLMLGGYGVTSLSSNGDMEYTPIRNSSTWLNIVYGDVWRPMIFVGYIKNLGTSEALYSDTTNYGRGLDIDQLLGCNLGLTYNQPSWSVGLEYSATTAWYGDLNLSTGRIDNSSGVTNHRVVAVFTYLF